MEKYPESIVTSSLKYLMNLQYLAKDPLNTLEDLLNLHIINTVYQWACWYEISETDKVKIQRVMNNILNKNTDLEITNNQPFKYYKNVSLPQSIWTWQRVYDNLEINEINEL
jgi:hypothetical protein